MMHCIKCGTELPPEAATCPTCSAPTPYNITSSPQPASKVETDLPAPNSPDEATVIAESQATPSAATLAERTVVQQPQTPGSEQQSLLVAPQSSPMQPTPQVAPQTFPVQQWPQPSQAPQGQPTLATPQSSPMQPTPQVAPQTFPVQQWPQPSQAPQQPFLPAAPQPRPSQPAFCGTCGKRLLPSEMFCSQCGTRVSGWSMSTPTPIAPEPMPTPGPAAQPYSPPMGMVASPPVWQQPQSFPVQQQFQPRATTLPFVSQPLPTQPESQRSGLPLVPTLLLVIVVLLVIGAGGLIYYVPFGHPAELRAQATSVAQAFLAAQSPKNIYTLATSGKPIINDPLNDPGKSIWSNSGSGTQNCLFQNNAYHIHLAGGNGFLPCFSTASGLSNFAFQVQIVISSGSKGGLLFRIDDSETSYYSFGITQSGFYFVDLILGPNQGIRLNYGLSSAINTAPGEPNLLTVIARNSTLYIYIKKQSISIIHDNSNASGSIGLFAVRGPDPTTDVAFSNAKVWKL